MNEINWKEMLQTLHEYSLKVPEGCDYIAEKLRCGEFNIAFKNIAEFSEGIVWMLKAKEYAENNSLNFPITRLNEVLNTLKDISEAIEEKEFEDAADLFEYEMKGLFGSLNMN